MHAMSIIIMSRIDMLYLCGYIAIFIIYSSIQNNCLFLFFVSRCTVTDLIFMSCFLQDNDIVSCSVNNTDLLIGLKNDDVYQVL